MAEAGRTAFVGVNVVPMNRKEMRKNQTVTIADGRIATVKENDGGRHLIDGENRYLLHGLGFCTRRTIKSQIITLTKL